MIRFRNFGFCVLLFGLFLSPIVQAELLSNGGFEGGNWQNQSSVPDDWWKWSDSWGWASWKNNSSKAHSGSKFICAGGSNSSQFADFGEDVNGIRAGDIFEFKVWAKTEGWGSPTAAIVVEFKNENNEVIETEEEILFEQQQSPSWQQYCLLTGPAPAGTVQANFICEGIGQGSVYFDDVSVILIPTDDPGMGKNTGFEEGTWVDEESSPDNWWKWSDSWVSAWASWKNDSSKAHSGSKFICLGGGNSGKFADFGQNVNGIRTGAVYLFKVWAKTENWGAPTGKLKVEYKDKNNEVLRIDEEILFEQQIPMWQEYCLQTNPAPAGAVQANFICEGIGQGSVYFDDIYIIPAPVTDGEDLLVNSGFEEGTWIDEGSPPGNWWKWSDSWGWASWKNDADYALNGSKFISAGGDNWTEYATFGQSVSGLEAGKTYILSSWVRAESIWWGCPTAELHVEFKDSGNNIIGTDGLVLFAGRNPDWNWYNFVTIPAPAGTTQANFICYAEGEGTMWFDDVKATLYVPDIAKNPSPRNEESNVDRDIILSWVAGETTVSHDVYFGEDFNDVNEADTSSEEYKGNQSFGNDIYEPEMVLELGRTYYWRIDEVVDESTFYKGDVWSFTLTNLDTITVDTSQSYQEIDGFGGSMTESSAYLMSEFMSPGQRQLAMDALFDDSNGIGLSYLRQPMGTSDFRVGIDYTYADTPDDFNLVDFSIANDMDYVIPMLHQAIAVNPDIKIMSSPWSAPAWLKDTNSLYSGSLEDSNQVYETYADYFVKYVQAYEDEGFTIDTVTLQNEPNCIIGNYPCMNMPPVDYIRLVKILGSKFDSNGINTKILTWDYNWENTNYPIEVLDVLQANQWVAGTAFHGYAGVYQKQSIVKDAYPDKEIYFTEYTGTLDAEFEKDLMRFTSDLVIGSIREWSKCIIMWNLALDTDGLPRAVGSNNCRGIITVDRSTGGFVKNAEYYALGHASKFLEPGAVRVASSEASEQVRNVAFQNPDGSVVVVVLNENQSDRDFRMEWGYVFFDYILPGRSVITFKWANNVSSDVEVWLSTADQSSLLEKQDDIEFCSDIDLTDGLMVYFPFDEDGQGTVTDESGCGNHGTDVGSPTYTPAGKFGGAYDFDPYDYVTLGENPTAGLENITVSLWFKTVDPTNNYKLASAAWWSYGGGYRPGSGWIVGTHYPEAWSQDNNSIPTESSSPAVSFIPNAWNHVVMTYDGIRLKEYINGQIARNLPTTGKVLGDANGRNLEVGAWSQYYRNYNGLIDEFRVYDRALSVSEVMMLYEGLW